MRASALPAAVDRNRRNAKAHGEVRVGAPSAELAGKAQSTRSVEARTNDPRGVRLTPSRANADRVEAQAKWRLRRRPSCAFSLQRLLERTAEPRVEGVQRAR